MTPEELKATVERLRERRTSIPALRDYRPQKGKGKGTSIGKATPIDVISALSGIIKPIEEETDANQEGQKENETSSQETSEGNP